MSKVTQDSRSQRSKMSVLAQISTMDHRSIIRSDSTGSVVIGAPSHEPLSDGVSVSEEASINEDGSTTTAIEVKTEKLDGRRRQITAMVQIPHSVEEVWSILTDYEKLADFIPSLKQSRRIDHPAEGIRVEQIGSESLLKVKFCARVVLDMVETFPHCLSFEMVEGDFKMFCGEWQLQSIGDGASTELTYVLRVWPSRLMPVGMIEKRLSNGLQVNLSAIKQRADQLFG